MSAQGMLVAVIAALAAALIASLVAYDRLARRSAAVIAEAQAAAHEAQAIARQAIDKLAEKNIELDRAKSLMQLQNRAQADIERIFLGFVRQASPETADALAREFASVNAFLGLHRAMAPHRVRKPSKGGAAGG